jgi:hypothetical protein
MSLGTSGERGRDKAAEAEQERTSGDHETLRLRTHLGRAEEDLLLAVKGLIVFATVAGRSWLAGPYGPLGMQRNLMLSSQAWAMAKGIRGSAGERLS